MDNSSIIKVSVIVPVYNAGIYLKRCLGSLSIQTLKEMEIILVLDCPTDGSDKVAEEFALRDSRFRILRNSENLHIGNSRNEGLKAAKGEYVAFCDHDDYVAPNMYETLYRCAVNLELDLVCSPAVIIRNSGERQMKDYPSLPPESLPFSILKGAVGTSSNDDELKNFPSSGAIWCKLFKRSMIEEHNLRFVDTKKLTAEDLLFLMEYAYRSHRAGQVHKPLYRHVLEIGNTGATLSYINPDKIINYLKYLYDFLSVNSLLSDPDFRFRFNNTVKIQSLITLHRDYTFHKSPLRLWSIVKRFKSERIVREAFQASPSCIFIHPTMIRGFLFKILRFIICH
ncbi:glycosyltransferase [Parabacteroides sp.]|uniref:glycosyltransferase n=1 Tax=Parabacteroides sp. TaxID=1869337 RepID=UPI00257A77E5|nr:glycosyltransferase [Parabacteroides sp.]